MTAVAFSPEMRAKRSFFRKIYYIIGIGVLLILLYQIGHPATKGGSSEKSSPGGILAQKREEYKLSQTHLGEIDPASESIKLATLGLRGVAALMLWIKADDYKMREDWTKYEATLNQIAVVQPHFIRVWIHLAWNLSYNVSVEFDNYRDRYHWVIEGIKYLEKGIANNNSDPRLLWETGWTVSQKIGRADEHKLYRKLFKEDDEFHGTRPKAERDNWLVGKTWYDETIKVNEETHKPVTGKGPLIFNSSPAMCLMNYAEAMEDEGTFGENAQRYWKNASKAWEEYGQKLIPEPGSEELRLASLEKHQEMAKQLSKELDDIQPGLREKIRQNKYDALSEEQRKAYEKPVEKRTEKENALAYQAEAQLEVTYEEIANKVPVEQKAKAKELAKEALRHDNIAIDISRSRDTVNYAYWELRAKVEQEKETVKARELIYEGTQFYRREANLIGAKDKFQDGFLLWRKILDKYPALVEDGLTGDDLMDMIKIYREILHRMDEEFPKPFTLQDIIDKYDRPR